MNAVTTLPPYLLHCTFAQAERDIAGCQFLPVRDNQYAARRQRGGRMTRRLLWFCWSPRIFGCQIREDQHGRFITVEPAFR